MTVTTQVTPTRDQFLPHIDALLKSMRISRDRMNSQAKVAIDIRIVRALLLNLARYIPFEESYYLSQNPDIASAHAAGTITDLHEHFAETGFFEGRVGAHSPVDEAFYAAEYNDIEPAIRRGDITSGADHYQRSGAAEGRVPNAAMRFEIARWTSLLAD